MDGGLVERSARIVVRRCRFFHWNSSRSKLQVETAEVFDQNNVPGGEKVTQSRRFLGRSLSVSVSDTDIEKDMLVGFLWKPFRWDAWRRLGRMVWLVVVLLCLVQACWILNFEDWKECYVETSSCRFTRPFCHSSQCWAHQGWKM